MTFDPPKHHRQSIRLRGYDYAAEGAFLVTICTYQRQPILGAIDDTGEMLLSTVGCIVQEEWERTAVVRPSVVLDTFVVMPNHLHGIIMIEDMAAGVCRRQPPTSPTFGRPLSGALGTIIGQFKSIVTKRVNKLYGTSGTLVWQRNYHDHVIRNENALQNIRRYIDNNPQRWAADRYYSGSPTV